MGTLADMVKKILRSYSYNVLEDREGDLFVARKDERLIMVGTGPEDNASLGDYINGFLSSTSDFKGQRVVATLAYPVPDNVLKLADEQGVAIWDHRTLESELGRLSMKDISQDEYKPDEGEYTPQIDDFTPSMETKVKDWGEQIMRPKLTLDDMTELAKYTIRGFRYELEVVPYYVFEYSCEIVIDGKAGGERKLGLIGVNALSGDYELWKTRFELVPELQWAHTKLEPKLDGEKAEHIARDGVNTEHTNEVENVVDRGTALIMEKRKVQPKEGSVLLRRKGLIYLPVWCAEGSNGVMLVNAVTGKIIKEDFYKDGG
jgi:hypothetical protein